MADGSNSVSTRLSDESVVAATGKVWGEWFALIESLDGRSMTQSDIANKLYDDKLVTRPWWGQMIAVTYEQHIGRRVVGQDCNGQFASYASRTITATLDVALDAWRSVADELAEFNNVPMAGEARTSSTDKYRYWRVSLADGSSMSVTISRKGEKAVVAVDHRNVESKEAGESWKAYWKTLLGEMSV